MWGLFSEGLHAGFQQSFAHCAGNWRGRASGLDAEL